MKSTALRLADNTKLWLTGFGASSVGLLALSGMAAGQGVPYYVGVAGAGAHLAWQLKTVNLDNPDDCLKKFKSNKWYGGIVFGSIVAGHLATGS